MLRSISLIAFSAWLTPAFAQSNPVELQSECLRYRDEITRYGHMVLESVVDDAIGHSESELRIWFNNDSLRFDIRGRPPAEDWGEWRRIAVTSNHYTWIPEGAYEGVKAPLDEYAHEKGGVVGHFGLFHPKWLGMGHNSETLMQIEPSSRVVSAQATRARYRDVLSEDLGGIQTLKVTIDTSFPGAAPSDARIPGTLVLWFAPSQGNSLIRAELSEFNAKATSVRSVKASLERFGSRELWFPRFVERATQVGGTVTRRVATRVVHADFDVVPDDAVFTLASMELPAGKQVADRTRGTRETVLRSDGEKLVPVRGPFASIADDDAAPPSHATNWLLILNAIVLAAGGLWLLLRVCRRLRKGVQ